MPWIKLKKVWDYCTYNKPFFLLVALLFLSADYIYYIFIDGDYYFIVLMLYNILIAGYGMSITRDRINEGFRLPKILLKDIFVLGIKATIVFTVYLYVQGMILDFICFPLDFPAFNLEEMLIKLPETLEMLYSHEPTNTIIFIVVGAFLFYVSAFFMEIALAKLADTGSLKEAFNLLSIKRSIDLIGWREYTKDYTRIIITIVLFTYLQYIEIPIPILDIFWAVAMGLFAFATQYMGIGAVYSVVKKRESSSEDS